MKLSRSNRRRKSLSRRSQIRNIPAFAVEQLERKQLLSATNGSDDGSMDVDPALQTYRDEVVANIMRLADSQYGDLWGTEAEKLWYVDLDGRGFNHLVQTKSEEGLRNTAVATAEDLGSEAFSTTNVQVHGVDEADIVETDGNFIYTLTRSSNELIVVRAADADEPAAVVSQITLDSHPESMFLIGDRLTVISTTREPDFFYSNKVAASLRIATYSTQTRLTVFDVADPSSPSVLDETVIDGDFNSARAVGNEVTIVLRNRELPFVPSLWNIADENSSTGSRFENRDEFEERLTEDNSDLCPPSIYQRTNPNSPEPTLTRLGWLDSLNSDVSLGSESLVSVLKFDTSQAARGPSDSFSFRTSAYGAITTYATTESLYIATSHIPVNSSTPDSQQDEAAPSNTLATQIHKIDISSASLQLAATGTVPGFVESQFSLDEHDGYLRIVTTTGFSWTPVGLANHLFVLQDTGTELTEVGSIRDLAPTERIYSARFDGDRGWMVTFRQSDPVFSFDLSDPENPVVTGELKIPGYSDYLQMIDDDHLLAIGRDATDEGRVLGLQVSLFNISDPQNPTLLHRYNFSRESWGNSEATNSHLAFNYLPSYNLLAIPFNSNNGSELVMLNIDADKGISLAGDIGGYSETKDPDTDQRDFYYRGTLNWIHRSIHIEDRLYAVGETQIHVVHLDSPDEIETSVQLTQETDRPWHLTELPWRLQNPFNGRLRLTQLVEENSGSRIQLSVDSEVSDSAAEISQFEFRILDPETGDELARQISDQAEFVVDELLEIGNRGQIEVQARVLRERLVNAAFTRWSDPLTITLSATGKMLSETEQMANGAALKWSAIRDRIETSANQGGSEEQLLESYEVWISDADAMERVALHTDVTDTRLPLDLEPGDYFTWVRGVFSDGTKGDWSLRENLKLLHDAPELLTDPIATANKILDFNWQESNDLESYELQVTSPDGQQTVFTISDLTETSAQLNSELQPGKYSVRVRGFTDGDRPSAWSRPVSITIEGRPEITIDGEDISWSNEAGETFEIWVANAQNERIYHHGSWRNPSYTKFSEVIKLDQQDAGQIRVWVRSTLPDGSKTDWSAPKTIYHNVPDQIILETANQFGLNEQPVIEWQDSDGIDSYEVFVKRIGEAGAFVRMDGLTETSLTLTEQFSAGNYRVWVRGALNGGGWTNWGESHDFSVSDAPGLSVVDNVATWSIPQGGQRFELWVNRYNESGDLLETQALHDRAITENSMDLSTLDGGHYGVWVRSISKSGESNSETDVFSSWSRRVNVVIEQDTNRLGSFASSVDNIINDVIADLDLS